MTASENNSIGERIKRRFCSHSWRYNWKEREKQCLDCRVVRPIEKEYEHDDENAKIGETKIEVLKDRGGYLIERQKYQKTGLGSDLVYFQWFPSGHMRLSERDLEKVMEQIDTESFDRQES